MKRKPFLKQLSREHHHALVLARKVVLWASEGRTDTFRMVRDSFLAELAGHFHAEESSLLPMLAQTDQKLVQRTLADHLRLRKLAMQGSTMEEMHEFGELLRAHVRFEERELFPALERRVQEVSERREKSPIEDSILRRHDYIWATLPFLLPMAKKMSQSACDGEGSELSDQIVKLMVELHAQLLEHLSSEESLLATVLSLEDERSVRSLAAESQSEHAALIDLLDQVKAALGAESELAGCDCATRDTLHHKLASLDTQVRSMMAFEEELLGDACSLNPLPDAG